MLGLKSKVLDYLFHCDEVAPLYLCCYLDFTQIRCVERKAGCKSNMVRVICRLNVDKKKVIQCFVSSQCFCRLGC